MSSAEGPSSARRFGGRGHRIQFVCLVALFAASAAHGAEPIIAFKVPSEALGAALIDFAVQADISISLRTVGLCGARGPALIGRFTVDEGLRRLLAGGGCGFRRISANAYEITPPRPAPTPAATAPMAGSEPPQARSADLIVVATRHPTPADRLAYSVSAVAGPAMESAGLRDLGDVAGIVPAMTVTNLGAGRDKILLRGLSDGPLTGRTQSMIGLYLDDMRLTFDAPDPDLALIDMDRVEILRGPRGTLYGGGSLGGVVQLISNPPDGRARSAWAAVTLGATQNGAGSDAIQGGLNLPILAGRGAARVVFYRDADGGYIKDPPLGLRDANRSERHGARLALKLDLNDRWSATGGLVLQSINAADTQYAFAGQPAYTRTNQVREPHDNDFAAAHFSLDGDLGWARSRSSIGVIQHGLFSRYDATSAAVVAGPAAFDQRDDISSVVTETTLSSTAPDGVAWLAGLFYAHTEQSSQSSLTALEAPQFPDYLAHRRDRRDEAAAYGEVTTPLYRTLELTLGGRLFSSTDRVSSTLATPPSPAQATYAGVVEQSGFAPKIVLSQRPASFALIYVQAAEGYRPNGINTAEAPGELFASGAGPEPPRRYQGDELWSFEAGAKLSFDQGRLRLRVTGFDAAWKNVQSDQLLPSGLPFTANIGDGRNSGVELEGAYRVGALELHGQYLLNAPEIVRANSASAALADFSLAAVPDRAYGASAHYAWALPGRRALELDARYAYVGPSHLTLDTAATRTMGDYATARIATTLVDGHWRITIALDNPADTRGDTFAFGNPFTLRSTPQITPLRPRTLWLTLKASY